ncbi:MAG TPA: polysaccharide deacetylase family protein [Phnomibacter sp.]|nr:polysaccharide deacetylase family protein [Phnomibacter sp.]
MARQLVGKAPLLPYQHVVSNNPLQHIAEVYPYKNEQQFKNDIDTLLEYCNKQSLEKTLTEFITTGGTAKGSFILSFDDGFKEAYTTIAPMLKKKGVNAIFFINPNFIDNKKLFYRNKISTLISLLRNAEPKQLNQLSEVFNCENEFETLRNKFLAIQSETSPALITATEVLGFAEEKYLQEHQPYLTTAQIQQLSEQGFLFGGHSMSHPYYNRISLDEQLAETVESIEWVHRHIQQDLKLFSFPHSDAFVKGSFFQRLKDFEYRPDILFGTQNMKSETAHRMLHRFNAERPQFDFQQLVKAMALYTKLNKTLKRNTITRMP